MRGEYVAACCWREADGAVVHGGLAVWSDEVEQVFCSETCRAEQGVRLDVDDVLGLVE